MARTSKRVEQSRFDEREGFAVVADQVQLAFGANEHVVFCDEDVTEAAEVPVAVGFTARSGPASFFFFFDLR
jgi:hypothetical protein